jgi:type II secretory pathway component GspD/PulD (secretin)
MKPFSFLLLLLLPWLLWSGLAAAETDDKVPIEIIELQHRSANELLPHIQPLLGPRDALTGTGYRLIVRTSPGRLNQVREVVAQLDQPIRELRLSVRVSDDTRQDERRLDPAGEIDHQGRVVRRYATTRRDSEQWLRVQDGQQAHIREGEVIPMAGAVVFRPDGSVVGGVDYQSLDRGFVVTPRLMPDGRVHLHIVQIAERESPAGGGRVETRALETVVTVEPGEWVNLGGTVARSTGDDQRIIGTRRTKDREAGTVQVKIDVPG